MPEHPPPPPPPGSGEGLVLGYINDVVKGEYTDEVKLKAIEKALKK